MSDQSEKLALELAGVKPLPPVPVEEVERPSGNLFGKTLNNLRAAKRLAIDSAKHKLFDRHKITYMNSDRYKLVEDRIVYPGGREVTELRLYQLIDAAVVTVNSEVTSEIQGGIQFLREFNRDGTPKSEKN